MVQTKALRLFILGIDDQSVHANLGPAGTFHCIPQEGASEFEAMIAERDGEAAQARHRHGWITWRTFGKAVRHLREKGRPNR